MAIVALTLSACAGVSFTAEPSIKVDHTSFNFGGYSSRAVKVDTIDNDVTPTFYIASERELGDSTPKDNFVLASGLDVFDQDAVVAWVADYTGIANVVPIINGSCRRVHEEYRPGVDGILGTSDDTRSSEEVCDWF